MKGRWLQAWGGALRSEALKQERYCPTWETERSPVVTGAQWKGKSEKICLLEIGRVQAHRAFQAGKEFRYCKARKGSLTLRVL